MIIRIMLIILGVAGLYISTYFTLTYYGIVTANWDFIPRICRMDENTCGSIIHSREAKLFGFPNSIAGLFFYAFVIGAAAVSPRPHILRIGLVIASSVTVVVGIYLTYSLLFKLRTTCVLCFTSHVINLAIFFLSLN
jgi:uncharacterized membrane protein